MYVRCHRLRITHYDSCLLCARCYRLSCNMLVNDDPCVSHSPPPLCLVIEEERYQKLLFRSIEWLRMLFTQVWLVYFAITVPRCTCCCCSLSIICHVQRLPNLCRFRLCSAIGCVLTYEHCQVCGDIGYGTSIAVIGCVLPSAC